MSRPAGARGLKRGELRFGDGGSKSRPAGARGLKLYYCIHVLCEFLVAPRRGAWIETHDIWPHRTYQRSRAPQGRVD